jgi:hypothetical protein
MMNNINKRDCIIAGIWGVSVAAAYVIIYLIVIKLCDLPQEKIDASGISMDLPDTNLTFGITFAAFSVTALSLFSIIYSKPWGEFAAKLNMVKMAMANYRFAVLMNIGMIFLGLLGRILYLLDGNILLIYNSISVFCITFISVFIYSIVKLLIGLLAE